MASRWYTIFCKPRKERQVATYLEAHDIDVYYPTLKVDPVNPRAAKIKPYFPRYVFVRADLDSVGIEHLHWAPGSVGLVKFGGDPAIVPDEFVDELQKRIAHIEAVGGLNLANLKPGDSVKILDGPFKGYEAIFNTHLQAEERVQVLLHWLGRQMSVKVNANAVEKRRRRR